MKFRIRWRSGEVREDVREFNTIAELHSFHSEMGVDVVWLEERDRDGLAILEVIDTL